MSDIHEEEDPSYRREMLFAWSVILKERDDLVKKLNKELDDYDTLKFHKERVDVIIDAIQERDFILTSSRFSRVLHNVTLIDRVVVGIKSLFKVRPRAAFEQLAVSLAAAGIGVFFALLAHTGFPDWIKKIFSAVGVASANAATSAPGVAPNLDPIQVYVILGFAVLIAVGFVWFAVAATLSKEAATRKTAMDMTKNVMLFMMGLVTGYLSNHR